jgi:glycine/D-amino acid oxidase-like deaminating enzyme
MKFMHKLSAAFHHNDERYFRTRNLHRILLARGFALVGLDRTDTQNHEFAFRKTFELEQTVERFNDRLPIFVEACRLIYSWKALREKMRNDHLQ